MPAPEAHETGGTVWTPGAATGAILTAKPGDILNHAFEVIRFIARGGMGEVFEGRNLEGGERVAIKVILPDKLFDPLVVEMFKREAAVLTRLRHEALVGYRSLMRDPERNLLYLVTEFIEGEQLGDMLGRIEATAGELIALVRRLGDGLAVAHAAGAVHRDIAPDNIIIRDGKLSTAKIIDFGIAKDLDLGTGTIVGDGFAGKLSYVSPEQLGEFGRDVGPWSDIYSLGLVILAVANRRHLSTGGTIANAVNIRRSVPDLSQVPDELVPVMARMLQPDPKLRFRSITELRTALDSVRLGDACTPSGASAATKGNDAGPVGNGRRMAFLGVAGALIVAGGFAAFLLSGEDKQNRPVSVTTASAVDVAPLKPQQDAATVVAAAVSRVRCAWLSVQKLDSPTDQPSLRLSGVASDPIAVQESVEQALRQAGVPVAAIDMRNVAPVSTACPLIELLQPMRNTGAPSVRSSQPRYTRERMESGEFTGQQAARQVLEVDVLRTDMLLVGLEPTGSAVVLGDLAFLEKRVGDDAITLIAPGRWRVRTESTELGWTGVLLLHGPLGMKRPEVEQLLQTPSAGRDLEWARRLGAIARAEGWNADMVWVETVDRTAS